MGDKAPRDAAGSPIVADQAVGSARPEGVEFDESFDSESGFTTRVPRSPRRSETVTLKIDASVTAEEIRRVRQELQDELQRNALDLDPAAVERLGMLTAAAGELGRVLGHVLQQGYFGADPDERAAHYPLRMSLDAALDEVYAAAVILRQADDLPAVDIARRGELIGMMRDASRHNQDKEAGSWS